MKREDLRRLFARARDLCGETEYVVFGGLAVLGPAGEVPPRMAASIDVDAYSKNDPGRVFELTQALGLGSPALARWYVSPMAFAYLYAALDERDRAFEWLEKSYAERSPWMAYIKTDPQFEGFRAEPRFARLLERIGFQP
jgi:hypothetical protein